MTGSEAFFNKLLEQWQPSHVKQAEGSRNKSGGKMISGLIWWILVGLVAGWLAGKVMKGSGFGVLMDIVVGIVGAIIGGWIFGRLGGFPFGGMLGTIVVAFAGAVIFLWLVRMIKKA
jgi:uncharacterized membrane protein YeaQ/YmgE (transglycosylase-associated protein family)